MSAAPVKYRAAQKSMRALNMEERAQAQEAIDALHRLRVTQVTGARTIARNAESKLKHLQTIERLTGVWLGY